MEGWWTQTAPQNICTCTQTSHATSPQPGVGGEKPTRRGAGSHSGVGGLALGVRTQCDPCLGLLAQYGGQETPILLQGWLRGAKWSPGQVEKDSSRGRLDGWTEGWTEHLCSAS